MDKFGWEINRPRATSLSPCSWRNQQREACRKSYAQSSIIVDHGGIGRGDVDLAEALLISSSKGLHGVVNANELMSTKVDSPLPPSDHHQLVEAISGSTAAEASQFHEVLLLQAAAAELAMSEAATAAPWADAFASDVGRLSSEHFGLIPSEPPCVHIVDAADEEEDVSAILSNCDNVPNLLSYSGNASSGESENCSSLHNGGGDERSRHRGYCSNVGEVVSRGPPNPDAQTTRLMAGSKTSLYRADLKRKDRGIDVVEFGDAGEEGSGLYRPDHVLQSYSSGTAGDGGGGGGFRLFFENGQPDNWKKPRAPDKCQLQGGASSSCTSIDFRLDINGYEPDAEALAQVKEMIYRAAAMRPVSSVEAVEKPKRKNVRISSDPQTVAARQRRERISERLRVLQRLVPGGSKMDTASMLDEAANYLKFLKSQVSALQETLGAPQGNNIGSIVAAAACSSSSPPDLHLSSVAPCSQAFPMRTLHYPQTTTQFSLLGRAHPHPYQKGVPTARAADPHPLQF